MKKLILALLLGAVFLNTHMFAKEMRALTLYGKVDPRLYVYIKSTYRSQSPDEMRKNYEECTRTDWNTNGARKVLTSESAIISTGEDKKSNYKVTIPIDYQDEDKCGWEYVDTELILKRDKKDKGSVVIGIASIKNKTSSYMNFPTGGTIGILSLSTSKNNFLLSSGSKIECYTKKNEGEKNSLTSIIFNCSPNVFSNINGVDKIETTNINIDIVVNKDKCLYVPSLERQRKNNYKLKLTQDYFRDYKEPLNRFKQLELDIKQFINNIFN